ncbi:hypothetical protein [Burkholderia sp. BCC1999]|nr:hypothetical protein [Burkholderia sp. BCC1999]
MRQSTIDIPDKIRGKQPLARVDVPYFVAKGAMAWIVAKAARQPETV